MSSPPRTDDVIVERYGGVVVISFNRPETRNAINRAVAERVEKVIDDLDDDPDLRVAILTGVGTTFSAGADLKAFARGEGGSSDKRGFAGIVTQPPRKPVIAAVEGYALGGGFEIVLACDLVVASETAVFGLPEVKRGMVAGAGGLFRLRERVPYYHAMEIALTGGAVSVERALAFGIVNRLTPRGGALAEARRLAALIVENAPLAVAASKQVVVESPDWPRGERFERQRPITAPVFASDDAREGAIAFAEKRPPVWRGR
jgi:enoyl-CoA hydratase